MIPMAKRTYRIITCGCGCGRVGRHHARGLLHTCYRRLLRRGADLDNPAHDLDAGPAMPQCSHIYADGNRCPGDRDPASKEYCTLHRGRAQRGADMDAPVLQSSSLIADGPIAWRHAHATVLGIRMDQLDRYTRGA